MYRIDIIAFTYDGYDYLVDYFCGFKSKQDAFNFIDELFCFGGFYFNCDVVSRIVYYNKGLKRGQLTAPSP